MKNFVHVAVLLLIVSTVFLFHSCANVSSPTGGPKDSIPPTVVRMLPEHKSLNFKGKEIEIQFDEYIQIENIKQELLITPDVEGNYEYKPIKNGVRLIFEKPFRPSTTYTLNFRQAIKDVTEKNPARDLKLVFSTGTNLDTMYVQGIVVDLLTGQPAENAVVSLYRTTDTLNVLKHKPYYFTRSDKQGKYLLENIRQDTYRIYALQDRNNNLRYDQQLAQSEKIAFAKSDIVLDSNYRQLNFYISRMDANPPKVTDRNGEPDYVEVEFDEGLQYARVNYQDSTSRAVYQVASEANKIIIYNSINRTDSIPIQVLAQDSMGNEATQTIKIKFDQPTKGKQNVKNKEKLNMKTSPGDGEKVLNDFVYTISFEKPVTRFDLQKIELLADTITPIPLDTQRDFAWNPYFTELTLKKLIRINQNVRVFAPKGTFFSVEGDTAALIKTTHSLKNPEDYGSISGRINTKAKYFVIQLLSSDYKVIAEQRNQIAYKFSYLNAGEYLIRIIVDENNNGKWDQGNFGEGRLPEMIFFGPKLPKLKENWDLTEQNVQI